MRLCRLGASVWTPSQGDSSGALAAQPKSRPQAAEGGSSGIPADDQTRGWPANSGDNAASPKWLWAVGRARTPGRRREDNLLRQPGSWRLQPQTIQRARDAVGGGWAAGRFVVD